MDNENPLIVIENIGSRIKEFIVQKIIEIIDFIKELENHNDLNDYVRDPETYMIDVIIEEQEQQKQELYHDLVEKIRNTIEEADLLNNRDRYEVFYKLYQCILENIDEYRKEDALRRIIKRKGVKIIEEINIYPITEQEKNDFYKLIMEVIEIL